MASNRYSVMVSFEAGKQHSGVIQILLDSFRYAGLIAYQEPEGDFELFTIHCPKSIANKESAIWAKQNADRMRSFGWTASVVVAHK